MRREWGARHWLGCALVLALGLLERSAPGGLLAFLATITILLLGEVRPRRRSLRDLAPVLTVVTGAVAALLTLLQTTGVDAPPGLAVFARLTCLGSATLLSVTPPSRLAFHVLALVVALWTATALAPSPSPTVLILTLATLASTAQALAATRARALVADAEASLVTGLPPGPRRVAAPLLPALAVVAFGVLPFALGWDLPRPPGEWLAAPSPRGGASAGALRGGESGARRVEFEPELGFDAPRDSLESDAAVVVRVSASPPSASLLLRGAALERATASGFFPLRSERPEPPLLQPFLRTLDVELLREQRGYLFAIGRPLAFRGVSPRPLAGGVGAPPGTHYPLRYTVECEVLHPRFFLSGLPVRRDDAALLQLPLSEAERAPLLALAQEAADGADLPYEVARNVESWLRRRCDYDTGQALLGRELGAVVTTFLRASRRGVCVEFSASMTVLLRLLGIPARVASGYRTEEIDEQGRFVVRARHAHAWVEVPFDGAGWVAFDPTPGSLGHVPFGESPQPLADTPEEGGTAAAVESAAPRKADDEPPTAGSPAALWVAALLLLACGGAAQWTRRRLRRALLLDTLEGSIPPSALRAPRERLFAALAACGYRLGRSETPREFVARIRHPDSPLRQAVERYTALRFSGLDDPSGHHDLLRLLDQARGEATGPADG